MRTMPRATSVLLKCLSRNSIHPIIVIGHSGIRSTCTALNYKGMGSNEEGTHHRIVYCALQKHSLATMPLNALTYDWSDFACHIKPRKSTQVHTFNFSHLGLMTWSQVTWSTALEQSKTCCIHDQLKTHLLVKINLPPHPTSFPM